MIDPALAVRGLTTLAQSLGLSISQSNSGPYIHTGLDTYFKLDTDVYEAWGTDEDHTHHYFDLEDPRGIIDCTAFFTRIADRQPEMA